MKIEIRPLHEIFPYEKNARKIPQRAVDKVAASLQEFGWQQPIVVDKHGVIIVGHVRRLAALQLGWTEAPVHVADKLTPAQIRAYRLMDNRSHEEATWDLDLLAPELADLRAVDFDLGLTGFNVHELDTLLRDPMDEERADASAAASGRRRHAARRPVALRRAPRAVRRCDQRRRRSRGCSANASRG